MNPAQIAVLTTELQGDPLALGYAAPLGAGSLGLVADVLNLVRPAVTIRRGIVTGAAIIGALDVAEFNALTQLQLTRLMVVCSASGGVDTGADGTRAILGALFPPGSSRTALVALADRIGSRAEQLFGFGTVVTVNDVARAIGRG